MSKRKYTIEQFEAAIPGSGGIMLSIARAVGCDWYTAQRFINRHPTLKAIFEAEMETNLDVAESLIISNIKIARTKQVNSINNQAPEIVDSTDAKWFVSKKGKGRGYSERTEQQTFNFDMSQLTTAQLHRIANGEDPVAVITSAGNS
jgi:hypothetical protein